MGMPRHAGGRVRRGIGENVFACFGVGNVDTTALVAAGAQETAVEAEADAPDGPSHLRQSVATDPVVGVPEADECVAAADGEVLAARTEVETQAGAGVGIEGEDVFPVRVREEFDGAGARGEKKVFTGVGEGRLVGLHRLRQEGRHDGVAALAAGEDDGNKGVVLVERRHVNDDGSRVDSRPEPSSGSIPYDRR